MDITVLNKSYQKIGIVDNVESFIWTDRYQGFGDFEIYTGVTAELLYLLQEDNYLQIKDSDRTMIIESIEIKTNVETGNKLIVKGRSLESLLDRRIVVNQTRLYNVKVQESIWELVIRAFILPEVSNGTQTEDLYKRTVPNLIWVYNSDTRFDSILTSNQYFLENLYDIVQKLCAQTNVGFKIILNSSNQFAVSVYLGQDRTYDQTANPFVVFSPNFDNLINSTYFRSKRQFKSWALTIGHIYDNGQLHEVINHVDGWDEPTGLEHRELYIDLQHIPRYIQGTTTLIPTDEYNAQLSSISHQIMEGEYAKFIEQFEGQADTTIGFKYGVDFFLGDIVQIENEYGLTGKARVTEITFSESPSGYFVYPTFSKI